MAQIGHCFDDAMSEWLKALTAKIRWALNWKIVAMVEHQALERPDFRKQTEDVQLMLTSPNLQRNTPVPTTLRGGEE